MYRTSSISRRWRCLAAAHLFSNLLHFAQLHFAHYFLFSIVITLRACARGKVIGRVVVIVVSTKIAISRDIGV